MNHYEYTIESTLKGLQGWILCIISVWFLLYLIRAYLGFLVLICFGRMVFYLSVIEHDFLYWGHRLSLCKIQKLPFKKVP